VKLRIEAFGDKPTTERITSKSGSFVHADSVFLPAAVSLRRSLQTMSNAHATFVTRGIAGDAPRLIALAA